MNFLYISLFCAVLYVMRERLVLANQLVWYFILPLSNKLIMKFLLSSFVRCQCQLGVNKCAVDFINIVLSSLEDEINVEVIGYSSENLGSLPKTAEFCTVPVSRNYFSSLSNRKVTVTRVFSPEFGNIVTLAL